MLQDGRFTTGNIVPKLGSRVYGVLYDLSEEQLQAVLCNSKRQNDKVFALKKISIDHCKFPSILNLVKETTSGF